MIPAEIIGQLGQLEMSSRPYSLPPAAFCWSEVPANRILTCLAVLIFLFNIRNLFSDNILGALNCISCTCNAFFL